MNILTIGIIYNEEGKFLITRRSMEEAHEPGIYSYPGGKLEFDGNETLNILEDNMIREIKEETGIEIDNIEYLSSHAFTKKSGAEVVAAAFMARHAGGEARAMQPEELSEVNWMTLEEINDNAGLDIVKTVYRQAADRLNQKHELHHIMVAGLILNANNEFLLIRSVDTANADPGLLTFPYGRVSAGIEPKWEALEHSLALKINELTGIEIADGPIPFTDQSFMGRDHFENIIQFFIGKYKYGQPVIKQPSLVSEIIWKKFADIDKQEMNPSVYLVFEKADNFVKQLSLK